MAFSIDYQRSFAALLAVVSSAILIWFGNGLDPWWPLLWFAPLPVLLFASRSSRWGAALTAFVVWLVGSLNMWHYFHVLHAPPSTWLLMFSIEALLFTASVLLFRALLLRGAWWSALLAFPGTWVSFEYLLNLISPHGTAGRRDCAGADLRRGAPYAASVGSTSKGRTHRGGRASKRGCGG